MPALAPAAAPSLGSDSARAALVLALSKQHNTQQAPGGVETWTPPSSLPPMTTASPPQQQQQQKPKLQPDLAWLVRLAAPAAPCDMGHVERFLALHPTNCEGCPRAAAFKLARSLPCFDRDLTAYYLDSPQAPAEYELCVAHSLMRISPPHVSHADFITSRYPSWRDRDHAMLHVLAVLAAHWDHTGLPPAPAGLKDLPLARSESEAEHCVDTFMASPQARDLAATIEAAAAIMRVKANIAGPQPDLPSGSGRR